MKTFKKLFLIGLLLSLSAEVFARGRARTMVDRLKQEIRTGRRTSVENIEHQQRRYERDLMRKLRSSSQLTSREINMDVLREYVKHSKNSPQNVDAITELVKAVTSRGNVVPAKQEATANVLAQAMRLQKESEFMIEPRDILEMSRNWTVGEQNMLADVFREARSLQQQDVSLSSNAAFERALANRGLLEKFKRKCT